MEPATRYRDVDSWFADFDPPWLRSTPDRTPEPNRIVQRQQQRILKLFDGHMDRQRIRWVTVNGPRFDLEEGKADIQSLIRQFKKRLSNTFHRYHRGRFQGFITGRVEVIPIRHSHAWSLHGHFLVYDPMGEFEFMASRLRREFTNPRDVTVIALTRNPRDLSADLIGCAAYMVKYGDVPKWIENAPGGGWESKEIYDRMATGIRSQTWLWSYGCRERSERCVNQSRETYINWSPKKRDREITFKPAASLAETLAAIDAELSTSGWWTRAPDKPP